MARSQPLDVVGGAYADDTRPWSVQDTVNYLVVNAERPGTRSPKMLRDVPGMVTFCASMPESSVRGMYVAEDVLLAVVGNRLYQIFPDGSAQDRGIIPGVGRVTMTHNQVSGGSQVVIATGDAGYVYDTRGTALDDGDAGGGSPVGPNPSGWTIDLGEWVEVGPNSFSVPKGQSAVRIFKDATYPISAGQTITARVDITGGPGSCGVQLHAMLANGTTVAVYNGNSVTGAGTSSSSLPHFGAVTQIKLALYAVKTGDEKFTQDVTFNNIIVGVI